jgi:predicted metal-dependent phosphoesterase TrpH
LSTVGRAGRRGGPPRTRARLPAADLHVHTTHSDGGCSPGEVVRAANNVGLSGLAITDHDTLSAIAVARPEAARLGVELIPGVELTTFREGRELHVLGHFIRDDDPGLVAACTGLREARARRIAEMTARLQDLGLRVDLEALRRTFPRATLGRKHLADWLVGTGQILGRREAFARYLGDDGPAHVEKPRLLWAGAIALIRGAGGVAGLAHPPYDLRSSTLREMVDAGLGAIEVDGPGIDARLGRRWRAWADELGLVPIAGTDFHAPDRPGRWVGAVTTPEADLARLRSIRGRPIGADREAG